MSGGRTLRAFAGYPATWAAAALSAASATGVALMGGASAQALAASAAGGAVSIVLWAWLGLRSRGFAHHLYKRHRREEAGRSAAAGDIARELAECGEHQASEQAGLLEKKMEAVRNVLLARLDEGELTFHRYLGTAEQVYLSGVDNLRELKVAATARNSIDIEYLRRREKELARREDAEAETERGAIEERAGHHRTLSNTVRRRLAQNEAIMAALDNTAASMAHARIGTKSASVEPEEAMEALGALAERTKRYEEATR